MNLPVLHPEKVLKTRSVNDIWCKFDPESSTDTMYDFFMENFGFTILHPESNPDPEESDQYEYNNDETGITAMTMKGFVKSNNIYTISLSFFNESIKHKRALYESASNFANDNNEFYGCLLLDADKSFYFRITKPEERGFLNLAIIDFSEEKTKTVSVYWNDIYFKDNTQDDIDIPIDSEIKAHPENFESIQSLHSLVRQIIRLVGYINNPTIIPHTVSPSKKKAIKKEAAEELIERYTIKVTYVTPATFKDRTYRILNSQVESFKRMQPCGPGRLFRKEVIVKAHERNYSKKE